MNDDIKKEIRKQYFRYFRVWFIIVGILSALAAGIGVMRMVNRNHSAPAERVYDYADVLTDAEEESLRQKIAEAEKKLRIDIVLVTFNQSVEGPKAMYQYGYRSADWELNMRDYADDFWDENRYGYNKGFEGDGCILVHNWYEGQNGEHLSTSGRVEDAFSTYDIDRVLYAVDEYYDTDPYRAYLAYIDTVSALMSRYDSTLPFSFATSFFISILVSLVYALVNLHQKKAKDTTTAATYVDGGKPVMRARADDFIRKNVVSRRIETSSSGGGGGSHSGGGGHHVSRSGASHGGGSHRH